MSRNLKALGLALMAVFAMSAIASATASAEVATFTSGSSWTTLSASAIGNQVFTSAENEVSCSSISVDNTSMGLDQATITAEPTYGKTVLSEGFTEAETNGTECEIIKPAKAKAMVHTNGCHYLFTAGNKTSGSVHIECPEVGGVKKEIEVTIDFLGKFRPCLDIPAQTPTVPTVDYTNETFLDGKVNKWDVRIKSTVEGITYTKTGVCGSGTFNDAHYKGEVTVKGKNTANEFVNVTWDPET